MNYTPTGFSGQSNPQPRMKPCPFCGGTVMEVHPYSGAIGAYMFCEDCRLSVFHGFCRNEEMLGELRDAWNRRVNE